MIRSSSGILGCLAIILGGATWVAAGPVYTFTDITNNQNPDSPDVGEQLRMTVDPFGSQVDFKFQNIGPHASSICDIYFDDGSLLGIAQIIESVDVDFSQGASPGNLPSGPNLTPPFQASVGFVADSDPPTQPNGVNNTPSGTEYVIIRFDLQGSQTYNDVINELNARTLRVGLHIQGFASGGSDSYVNGGIVPLPAAAWMGMSLLGSVGTVGLIRHRRRAVE